MRHVLFLDIDSVCIGYCVFFYMEEQRVLRVTITYGQLETGNVRHIVEYNSVGAVLSTCGNSEGGIFQCVSCSVGLLQGIDGSYDVLNRTVDAGTGNIEK